MPVKQALLPDDAAARIGAVRRTQHPPYYGEMP